MNEDDAGSEILYAYAPIGSVEIPESLVLGENYIFNITYTNPTPCHQFFGYEYVSEKKENIFGIVTSYYPDDPLCTEEEGSTEVFDWEFTAEINEKHIFKFWQGVDEDGEPIFLTKEVEVQETI